MRSCRRCKKRKPATEFPRRIFKRAGYLPIQAGICNQCRRQLQSSRVSVKRRRRALEKKWRSRNRPKIRARNQAYYSANGPQVRAAVKRYRAAHREQINQRIKLWKRARRERDLADRLRMLG